MKYGLSEGDGPGGIHPLTKSFKSCRRWLAPLLSRFRRKATTLLLQLLRKGKTLFLASLGSF